MTETECLHSCPLFRGLAEEDLSAALDFLTETGAVSPISKKSKQHAILMRQSFLRYS